MAILNFPPNPTGGQEYTAPTGVIYSYNNQYNVWTAFETPAPSGYITNVTHFFNNDTNITISLTSSNPGIIVTALNPTAADPTPTISCPFGTTFKKYSVTFSTPFVDTSYTIDVYNVSNLSAGGASNAYNSYQVTNKTVSGFVVQFCVRPTSSPGLFGLGYRRTFSIAASAA